MVGQYLSNTNESAIIAEPKNFHELNKALDTTTRTWSIETWNKEKRMMYLKNWDMKERK